MRLPDLFGIDKGMRGKCDHRLRIARAERTGACDRRHDLVVCGSGGDGAIDEQRIVAAYGLDPERERILEIGAECVELVPSKRDAGGHRMAAAFHQKPRADSLAHGLAKIDARNGTTRPGAGAAWVERDGKSRPPEPLPQPCGHEPHYPRMPALGGSNDYRSFLLRAQRGHCLGLGLRHRGKFDCLPLAIEAIEFARNARALGGIVMHEQLDTERGSADTAAGIDAWS